MWNNIKISLPPEGKPVITSGDKMNIAYYCDGNFYNLRLDPFLGVLRKEPVPDVKYWTDITLPEKE